jgi:phosphoribosylformylglycinamidine synthase
VASSIPPVPDAWAEGVTVVPVREANDAGLRKVAKDRGLGFSLAEMRRIRAEFRRLKREPTDVELAGLAQSWSEHCSYKSSKVWLKKSFRGLAQRPKVLGTGDAGVLRFSPGYAYAIRIESHNHPSAVEPYGGAATGIGGILRDVLAVGGKPIALADPLFFGPLSTPRSELPPGVRSPRYLMDGVVAGIRDYGNRVGVPTVSGMVGFDPEYTVNPLVNVACLGILPTSRLRTNRAERAGNRLVLAGGLTGRDGIGGVAFASRQIDDKSTEADRGHVQLGDPIMKEPLIHACLEAFDRGLVRGVKDLGGGGLATASGELVHSGGFGLRLHLDRVPLREPGVLPWEIWISESQERMILDVRPEQVATVLDIFRRYDVPATDVGEIVPGDLEDLLYHGRPASRMPLSFRIDPPLLTRRRSKRPAPRGRGPAVPDVDLGGLFRQLVLAPDSVSREPVIRMYDHEVQARTVIKPLHGRPESPAHGDAAVLTPVPGVERAIAVATASQPWACREEPRRGGVWTVEEAARNLYAVGARPDAFTDCLNFGSPEDPRVMSDFAEVVQGLADGARALGFSVPSGNVSFYNLGLGHAALPTPVLMATGLVPSYLRAVTSDLKESGDRLYLVGRSSPNLGGSLYARLVGRTGLSIPPVGPAALRDLGERLMSVGRRGALRAAHDVSDGGLALTLFEMAAGGGLGFDVDLDATGLDGPGLALAAEGASRWVVEVPERSARSFERAFARRPVARLGTVTSGAGRLFWKGRERASVDIASLYPAWRAGPEA